MEINLAVLILKLFKEFHDICNSTSNEKTTPSQLTISLGISVNMYDSSGQTVLVMFTPIPIISRISALPAQEK